MKPFVAASILTLSGLVTATITLTEGATEYTLGKQYTVNWVQDQPYILELHLVKRNDRGWDDVFPIWKDRKSVSPKGTYKWQLNDTYPTGKDYALWLSGRQLDDFGRGYADLSDWFELIADKSLDEQFELKRQE